MIHILLEEFERKLGTVADAYEDSQRLLSSYEKLHTKTHTAKVSQKAAALCARFGGDPNKAKVAGILHDISTVFPNETRVELAEYLGIDLYPEERRLPMIIHQKLSMKIALLYFGVSDPEILSAIECHTTLKANPGNVDMTVFLADKIDWDQPGQPPYLAEIEAGLNQSLEQGTFNFIDYLIRNRSTLKVVHPWLVEAHEFLKNHRIAN